VRQHGLDQLVAVREVVEDRALRDAGPARDLRQRRLPVADFGDGADRALDQLRAPDDVHERPLTAWLLF
jgi:hypothetical protein